MLEVGPVRRLLPIALLLAAARAAADAEPPATEARYCEREATALKQRARIFREQGLSPAEIRRQNAPYEQYLAECRKRFQQELRWQAEERRTLQEIADRTPPGATQLQRAGVEREIRLRRARQRRREELSPAERKLLAEADAADAARREADDAARDPALRRRLLSAERCAYAAAGERARAGIAEEERLAGLGSADRTRSYRLQGERRRAEEVLARNGPELEKAGGPLPCDDGQVAPVALCIEAEASARAEPACEQPEMGRLLRILRGP